MAYLSLFCIHYLPFITALFICLNLKSARGRLQMIDNKLIIGLYFLITLLLALTPATYFDGSDKGRYLYEFDNINFINISERTKDLGWIFFVKINHFITFGNSSLYFIITAAIYAYSFYYFARKNFNNQYVGYFLLASVGSLGFASFTNNVIRNGVALAFCLYALSTDKKILSLLLISVAYTIHGSILIPVAAFVSTIFLKNSKWAIYIWLACLTLCILHIDLSSYWDQMSFVDERVSEYSMKQSDDVLSLYKKAGQFRWDFLLYSIVPFFFAWMWKIQFGYTNSFYDRIVNTYILCNAFWLLVMRQAFSDRFAFLSWILIPIVTLYPLLRCDIDVPHPTKKVTLIILIFLSVQVVLSIRS